RNLAAEDREQRRTLAAVEDQAIIARDRCGRVMPVIDQRAHAAPCMYNILRRDLLRERAVDRGAQIIDLALIDDRLRRVAGEILVSRADHREILLPRDREDDALVR